MKRILFIVLILVVGLLLFGCTSPVCGNHVCETGETLKSCPVDCNTGSPVIGSPCGDGVCEGPETMVNCPVDCNSGNSITQDVCGDGTCSATEKSNGACSKDCNSSVKVKPINNNSPFGAIFASQNYNDYSAVLKDLGIKAVRYGGLLGVDYWLLEKPENVPSYFPREVLGWDHLDKLYKDTNNAGIEMSVIITSDEVPVENPDGGVIKIRQYDNFTTHGTNLSLKQYSDFVKTAIARYPYVTYWEIDNEPDLKVANNFLWEGNMSLTSYYAQTVKTAYLAIKSVNPNAKVALGAIAVGPGLPYFESVFKELAKLSDYPGEKFFDVFNFHYYSKYMEYGQKTYENSDSPIAPLNMPEIKVLLDKYGYSGIEMIVTESGAMSGGPGNNDQTEAQQATNLLKRYVYFASQRVDKQYWFNINENSLPNTPSWSLISTNDGQVTKKLGYYTYKLMVEKLEGSDWNKVQEIYNTDNVYAYKLIKNGKPAYVLWWDYFDETNYSQGDTKTINLSDLGITGSVKITKAVPKYSSGTEVTDYSTAFDTTTTTSSISLGEIPVYVEANGQ